MFERFYAGLWFAVALVSSALYLTGSFNPVVLVVFGFVTLGLVFMGMMCVLPTTVAHPKPVQYATSDRTSQLTRLLKRVVEFTHTFKSKWMFSNGVEVRKPIYPRLATAKMLIHVADLPKYK